MKLEIKTEVLRTDPSITIYHVEAEGNDGSIWRETYGTKLEVLAFLRGCQCHSMTEHNVFLKIPEMYEIALDG